MAVLYGLGVIIAGAYLDQTWMIAIGFVLFFGGGVWAFISLVLEENNISIADKFEDFLNERKNQRVPPESLRAEVERFATSSASLSNFYYYLGKIRTRTSDYPALQRRLDQIARNVKIPELVEHHSATLQRKISSALKKDDYGTIIVDRRDEEIEYFLASMNLLATDEHELSKDIDLVKNTLRKIHQKDIEQGFDPNSAPTNGIDFEYWVAENLERYGWLTEVTKASGEQGLDILAKSGNTKIAIQCKRYTSNVGNDAVQQALSASKHYQIDKSVVITTSGYTKSAKELAATTGVILLTHFDIPNFTQLTGTQPAS